MTSREIQDIILRLLCDGPLRHKALQGGALEAEVPPEVLARIDGEGLARFARFLARHFYRERIVHLFKYSRALAHLTGRRPEEVLKSEAFNAQLPRAVIGSRRTAAEVADLLYHYLVDNSSDILARIPYWLNLVRYECAFFVADAIPEEREEPELPARAEGAQLIELEWDLPSILSDILKAPASPPMPPRKPTIILISRSREGRVSSMACSEAIARLFNLIDGKNHVASLAEKSGLSREAVDKALARLAEIGAIIHGRSHNKAGSS